MRINELDDLSLIEGIQNGVDENENLKELINRHSGMYYHVAHRYFPPNGWGDGSIINDREFVFDSLGYVIHESAKKFDASRGAKFSTFLGDQAKYFCLNFINKSKNAPLESVVIESGDTVEPEVEELQDQINLIVADKIIEEIRNMEDKRIEQIFRMRYLDSVGNRPTSWAKIHKHIKSLDDPNRHLSIQRCIDIHNSALIKIRKNISKEQVFDA